MATDFVYDHLVGNRTRVFALQPATRLTDPIRIQLREISLELHNHGRLADDCQYEALSYVWGQREGRQPIDCDGKQLLITDNCDTALRFLRRRETPRLMWVDAICINQTSDEEKSHQVRRMGDIFRRAMRVLIWLGKGNDLTATAFQHLEALYYEHVLKEEKNGLQGCMIGQYHILTKELTLHNARREKLRTSLEGYFYKLLTNPYFSRIWTIQELVMSSHAVVFCGESMLSWLTFTCGMQVLLNEASFLRRQVQLASAQKNCMAFVAHSYCWFHRNSLDKASNAIGVERLLVAAFSHAASDPKDKVFALYDILSGLDIQLPAPDYRLSLETIFAEATRAIIAQTTSLSVWNVMKRGSRQNGPSWAMDLCSEFFDFAPHHATPSKHSTLDKELLNQPDPSRLHLRGFRFDVIGRRTDVSALRKMDGDAIKEMPFLMQIATGIEPMHQWLEIILERGLSGIYPGCNETSYNDVFLRFFERGMNRFGEEKEVVRFLYQIWLYSMLFLKQSPLSSATMEAYIRSDEEFKTSIANPKAMKALTSNINAMLWVYLETELNLSPAVLSRLISLFSKMEIDCFGKRFFITETGYLGTGPESLQVGDPIILFAGATNPFILRFSSANEYELIGPSLVQGIMDGEAWPDVDSSSLETFVVA